MDKMQLMILRLMAWERAKGELKSMLQTYVNEREQYEGLRDTIKAFIKDVEENGRHES